MRDDGEFLLVLRLNEADGFENLVAPLVLSNIDVDIIGCAEKFCDVGSLERSIRKMVDCEYCFSAFFDEGEPF